MGFNSNLQHWENVLSKCEVTFLYSEACESFSVHGATLRLFNQDGSINWKIESNLKSFEVLHGLSRIAPLCAQNLITAIEINREETQGVPDDGTFLIDQVIGLVKYYKEKIKVVEYPQVDLKSLNVEIGSSSTQIPPLDGMNLEELMTVYENKLQSFISDLEDRDEREMVENSSQIAFTSDYLLFASQVYIEFIHPVWIQSKRSNKLDPISIGIQKEKAETILEAKKNLCSSVLLDLV